MRSISLEGSLSVSNNLDPTPILPHPPATLAGNGAEKEVRSWGSGSLGLVTAEVRKLLICVRRRKAMKVEYQRSRRLTRKRILVLCSGLPACDLNSSRNQPCCRDLKTKIPCVCNGHERRFVREFPRGRGAWMLEVWWWSRISKRVSMMA
jgi:hypothetical protein